MLPVLIIDDDQELCRLLEDYLTGEHFHVEFAHSGTAGLERALAGRYAAVVLDVMLPGMNGMDVLKELRATSTLPVLMLTARGSDQDRITGLELGADDYLPKPFNPRELAARLRAILRRAGLAPAANAASTPLRVGDVEADPGPRRTTRNDSTVTLTSAEFDLLYAFLRAPGQVLSREDLTHAALGRPMSALDRAIDVHVSNLRRKLGSYPDGRERIKAVRGSGYVYLLPGEAV